MREHERLQKTITDAFLPEGPQTRRPAASSVHAGKNDAPPRSDRSSHVRRVALGLAVSACLIIAGVTTEVSLSLTLAGMLLMACAIALGASLLQMIRGDVSEATVNDGKQQVALERATRENEAKSRLLSTVSHDIRTPLSGIAGMSHLLSQTRLTPEQANYLAGIRQSANALSQLVDDLLDFSSIEAGRFQLRPSVEDPRQIVEHVVEMLAPRAHERGLEIASWVSADVPANLSFDPGRLRQVLYNLVGNAVKFTARGGVMVHVGLEDEMLTISVRDSGAGLSPEDQVRIFMEFEQAGSERDRAAGTGLGLAISRRIISQAGGSLTLESALGQGSTFTIRLPAIHASDFATMQMRRTALSTSRVLIIMPDGVCRDALRATIETLGGACVVTDAVGDVAALVAAQPGGFTDFIADHRLTGMLADLMKTHAALRDRRMRRIVLIDPESRSSTLFGAGYDSWLVRPLRECSLVGVLQGHMKGIELRDPLNDNRAESQSRWTQAADTGLNILIGEDDPVNRLLLRTVLKKAGHVVREAENFHTLVAAATAPANRPAVIVTDLTMPGGSGFDALAAIRDFERSNRLEELPIIVITASGGSETRRQAIESGATEVLAKPADPQKLLELMASYRAREVG